MSFDADKAVSNLIANKKKGSTGLCATHVRQALAAGGLDTSGNPVSAKDYGPFLLNKQFKAITGADVAKAAFAKADIVVIQPYVGGSAHGHIAMYSGAAWISDFQQRDIWGGGGYRKNKPAHAVYRYSPNATALLSALPRGIFA
jgi:hypothetical protein